MSISAIISSWTLALGVSAGIGLSLVSFNDKPNACWAGAGLLFLVGLLLTEGGMVVLPLYLDYLLLPALATELALSGLALILFALS